MSKADKYAISVDELMEIGRVWREHTPPVREPCILCRRNRDPHPWAESRTKSCLVCGFPLPAPYERED